MKTGRPPEAAAPWGVEGRVVQRSEDDGREDQYDGRTERRITMEDRVDPLDGRHPLEQPLGRIDGCRLDVRHAYRLELSSDTALRLDESSWTAGP
jgi:hypothetical protein